MKPWVCSKILLLEDRLNLVDQADNGGVRHLVVLKVDHHIEIRGNPRKEVLIASAEVRLYRAFTLVNAVLYAAAMTQRQIRTSLALSTQLLLASGKVLGVQCR